MKILNETSPKPVDRTLCPVCQQPYARRCKCLRADSICPNGHEWHYCPVHHKLVVGSRSDHSSGSCTCGREKT